jgi:hypothetical protein
VSSDSSDSGGSGVVVAWLVAGNDGVLRRIMALSRWRRANPVLTLAVLQAFFSELPDVRQAYAQEAKGIHCAVGTGSCGNWLELGGYKTSCKIFRDATLMRGALMSLTPCLPKEPTRSVRR